MTRKTKIEAAVFVSLVLVGSLTRLLLSDLPNFAPVAAIALFAGYFFRSRRVAVLLPLCVMVISDSFLGFYHWQMMALVYGALVLPVFSRGLLRKWLAVDEPANPLRATAGLVSCSLAASLLFFTVTNFGSWLWFEIYEQSWLGLLSCYVQAIPFFRYTLAGDLIFGVVLFGGYAFASSLQARVSPAKTEC